MDDDISEYYRLDAVVTIVDAKHGMETLDTQEEAQKQVGFADRILISKKDLVSDAEFATLRRRIVHINPAGALVKVDIERNNGKVIQAEIQKNVVDQLAIKKGEDILVRPKTMKVFG